MNTSLTSLLNIKYPIIQGAMAWVSDANLAATVSNAGGAGVIATGGRTTEWAREEIQKAKTLTDKPFGVNIVLMAENKDEILEVICEEKVAFVTLGAGNPVPFFEKLHQHGILAIPVVPSLKLAKRVQEKGADAIIIEGLEAGGHIGKQTTLALMTQVIPHITIPVIAAGGFAEGRGLAAALIMGSAGIQMGTRFYASIECSAHINAKNKIVEASDGDTSVTGYLHNHAVRGISNEMTKKYLELEATNAPYEELHNLVVGTSKKAPIDGDTDWGLVQAGQSVGEINSLDSCQQIIERTVSEAEVAYSNVKNIFGQQV